MVSCAVRFPVSAICSLDSGAPKAVYASGGAAQLRNLDHFGGGEVMKDKLGDPIPASKRDRLRTRVLENDAKFAPVVGIDGSWTVGQRNAVP